MFGGINNIYMGGYKFSAHCTNISAHKIYFRASLFICGEYFLDRTAINTRAFLHFPLQIIRYPCSFRFYRLQPMRITCNFPLDSDVCVNLLASRYYFLCPDFLMSDRRVADNGEPAVRRAELLSNLMLYSNNIPYALGALIANLYC